MQAAALTAVTEKRGLTIKPKGPDLMATISINRPPSLCETRDQLATALGDLQRDFRYIEGLSDFLAEELIRANHEDWQIMREYLLIQALEARVERFKMNLGAVAELAEEARQ